MQASRNPIQPVSGLVEVLSWMDIHAPGIFHDPSKNVVLHGGNVGHIALAISIPLEEIEVNESELAAEIKYLRNILKDKADIAFTPLKEKWLGEKDESGQPVKTECLEIYFSFWPDDEGNDYSLQSYKDDMLAEWSGRRSPPLNKSIAARVFGITKQEVEEYAKTLITSTKRSYLNPMVLVEKFGEKPVYSGPKTIHHHLNAKQALQSLKSLYEELSDIKNNDFASLQPAPIFRNISEKIKNVERMLDESGQWNNEILKRLSTAIEKLIAIMSEHDLKLSKNQQEYLDTLQKHMQAMTVEDNLTEGVRPDANIIFKADNFNLVEMIKGMEKMLEKKWQIYKWNCASTVLSILLNSLKDEIKNDPEITKLVKRFSKKKTSSFAYDP